MEVFIQDVPQQVTDIGLRKQLEPYMDKLSIERYHCQKPGKSRFAFLIFLHPQDGNKFLTVYGQEKPSRMIFPFASKVQIMSTPVFCNISRKAPSQFSIRSLQKEEKDQKAQGRLLKEQPEPEDAREFRSLTFACGAWSYIGAELVFVPYMTANNIGSAKFGSKSIIAQFDSGDRLEFLYSSITGITMEGTPSVSFTITLWEAPRSYHAAETVGQQRKRVSALNMVHQRVVGNCSVYRFSLDHMSGTSSARHKIADRMRALQKYPGLPSIITQHITIHEPIKSFSVLQQELDGKLADAAKFPFWTLNFQIRALVSNWFLTFAQVISILPQIQKILQQSGLAICVAALQKFRSQLPYAGPETEGGELELDRLIDLLQEAEAHINNNKYASTTDGRPREGLENLAMVHRITVTPAGVYLYGPDAEPMNRILRKYPSHHDSFIRVIFAEEDGEQVRFDPRVSNDFIYNERFKKVLREGINVAGRQYNFLGFSHSSLRAQSCWFMAPFTHEGSLLYDRVLVRQLGDFTKIRCPAKCAARIGQAFSETPIAVAFPSGTVVNINDVERNGRVFSDGVGTVSTSVMQKIWAAVPSMMDLKPTCFQIRYQGAKGMLSLDSRLEGDRILLRPSMIKFEGSSSMDIELCGSSLKRLPMFLNRQVIKLLEDMNVSDEWFLDLQTQEVQRLRMIMMNGTNAGKYLKSQLIGQQSYLAWFVKHLTTIGLDFRSDRFLRDILELSVMMQIRVLKYRARIPVSKGITLYGIMDETGILEEGQIFCIFKENGTKKILVGKRVVITRAPALHPGDVQVVDAVNVPADSALLDLCNCICFSQKGARDLPSKLSGGDLDGDLYNIIWDSGCRPTHTSLPADYARVPPVDIGRTVETHDMTDFFLNFMETDQLGRIATTHLILADQKDLGTSDPDCKILAELHSTAVDFSKTGIPVDLKQIPRFVPVRPDFMAPGPNIKIEKKEGLLIQQDSTRRSRNDEEEFAPYKYYESHKILGKLYRAVDERKIFMDLHKHRSDSITLLDRVWNHVSRACESVPWRSYIKEAQEIRDIYEDCLLTIMRKYSEHPLRPISELEAFIGNILGAQGSQSRKQHDLSLTMKEAFDRDVKYVVGCIIGSEESAGRSAHALHRSVACFYVSLEEATKFPMGGRTNEPLVSFRYVAAAVCLKQVEKSVDEHLEEGLGFKDLSLRSV